MSTHEHQSQRDGPAQVTVVMTCYNRANRLERSLGSCLRQTWPNLQIVFVDNNSTDDSVQCAEALSRDAGRSIEVVRETTQGMPYALRTGLARAEGVFLQWLDSDDALAPDKIERQVVALESEGADCAYGDWTWIFHDEDARRLDFPERERDDPLLELLANRWRPPHAYLLHRRVFATARTIHARLPPRRASSDREFFTLAALLGRGFHYVPNTSVDYHTGDGPQISRSLSRLERATTLRAIFADLRAVAETQSVPPLTSAHRALLDTDFLEYRFDPDAPSLAQLPPAVARLARSGVNGLLPDIAAVLARNEFARLRAAGGSVADALGGLRRALGLQTPVSAADLRDATALTQGTVPLVGPVLIHERIAMERALLALVHAGVLIAQPPT